MKSKIKWANFSKDSDGNPTNYVQSEDGNWINLNCMTEIRMRMHEEKWEIIAVSGTTGWLLKKFDSEKEAKEHLDNFF